MIEFFAGEAEAHEAAQSASHCNDPVPYVAWKYETVNKRTGFIVTDGREGRTLVPRNANEYYEYKNSIPTPMFPREIGHA